MQQIQGSGRVQPNLQKRSVRRIKFSINNTLNSQDGRQKILLIRSSNDDKSIFKSLKITKALKQSRIGKEKINEIRVNKEKGIIVVEFGKICCEKMEEFLKITEIGEWKVQCSVPKRDTFKLGIIAPIDVNDEDVPEL